jgi:hypothetical protein
MYIFAENQGTLLGSDTIKNDEPMEHETPCQRSNGYAGNNRGTVGSGVHCVSMQRLYLENRNTIYLINITELCGGVVEYLHRDPESRRR